MYGTVPYGTVQIPIRYRYRTVPCGTVSVSYHTVPYAVQRTVRYGTVEYCNMNGTVPGTVPFRTAPGIIQERYNTVPVPYRTVTSAHNAVSVPIPLAAIRTVAIRHRNRRLVYKYSYTALKHSCLIIILPRAFVPHLCDEPCGSVGLRPGEITTQGRGDEEPKETEQLGISRTARGRSRRGETCKGRIAAISLPCAPRAAARS